MPKATQITITVVHNGYLVECRDFDSSKKSWVFETMKQLQLRLPEIISVTQEQKEKQMGEW